MKLEGCRFECKQRRKTRQSLLSVKEWHVHDVFMSGLFRITAQGMFRKHNLARRCEK